MSAIQPTWQLTRAGYQALVGVHRPWACEVSPAQYAGMSRRACRQYDARRKREWDALAEVACRYAAECLAARIADDAVLGLRDIGRIEP